MMIREVKTHVSPMNHYAAHYMGSTYAVPVRQYPEIEVTLNLICNDSEYQELMASMMSNRRGMGFNYNNVKLVPFANQTITEDIVMKNKDNEEFLLSLLEGETEVVWRQGYVPFKAFVNEFLKDFAEKYKLLLT